eukprot:5694413-Alexandrium_andersonii.AAC.1
MEVGVQGVLLALRPEQSGPCVPVARGPPCSRGSGCAYFFAVLLLSSVFVASFFARTRGSSCDLALRPRGAVVSPGLGCEVL